MRKLLVTGLVALATLAPTRSSALVFLGARAGYAMPGGNVEKDAPMKDALQSNIPIQADLGMSVLPYVGVGLYGSYGPTTLASKQKDACSAGGVSCSGSQIRGGLQLVLRIPILDSLWGGAFAGLEQQSIKGGSTTTKYTGWEAGLQAGYDFSVLPLFKMGPFVSYGIGQFTSVSGGDAKIEDKAQHSALTVGLRALFDL